MTSILIHDVKSTEEIPHQQLTRPVRVFRRTACSETNPFSILQTLAQRDAPTSEVSILKGNVTLPEISICWEDSILKYYGTEFDSPILAGGSRHLSGFKFLNRFQAFRMRLKISRVRTEPNSNIRSLSGGSENLAGFEF